MGVPARQARERELVSATRALFDERGMQHAPIEEIAKAVGIARGLVYRHFSSKEELFVLTVTSYLDELRDDLERAAEEPGGPLDELERCIDAYARFCRRYPAFLDSALSLMQRSARDLHGIVSESVWLRLGQGMAACLGPVVRALRRASESGEVTIDDPDFMASVLWTQILGTMHLARIRVGVREVAPGLPELYSIEPDDVVAVCVASALATVGAPRRR